PATYVFFFFHLHPALRLLPSFPTRRSSDLGILARLRYPAQREPRGHPGVRQRRRAPCATAARGGRREGHRRLRRFRRGRERKWPDRKSTRLNSSHQIISYAVFCLKKKNSHM